MGYQRIQCKVVRKGKKDVNCEWCGEVISICEECVYRFGKFDGELQAGYMHIDCFGAMTELPDSQADEGWSPGDFVRGCSCERGNCNCISKRLFHVSLAGQIVVDGFIEQRV